MRRSFLTELSASFRPSSVAALIAIATPLRLAHAEDLLGFYVGGAAGQSRVETSSGGLVPSLTDHFKANHLAYKITAGIRPISLVGAELAYLDLGHPSGSLGAAPADVTMKGAAAFGVLYLPVPVIDLFVKAGAARLQSTLNGNAYLSCTLLNSIDCPPSLPFRVNRTNTNFAAGAGAQYKFGSWAVRAEYERFNAAGDHPSLLSLGLTWIFR